MKKTSKETMPAQKQAYEVSPSGSLGLLALGYRGLVAWRDALRKFMEENQQKGMKDEQKNS